LFIRPAWSGFVRSPWHAGVARRCLAHWRDLLSGLVELRYVGWS
jgi:hypothetical protein